MNECSFTKAFPLNYLKINSFLYLTTTIKPITMTKIARNDRLTFGESNRFRKFAFLFNVLIYSSRGLMF